MNDEYEVGDQYRVIKNFMSLSVRHRVGDILKVVSVSSDSMVPGDIRVATPSGTWYIDKSDVRAYTEPINKQPEIQPEPEKEKPKIPQKRLSKVEFLKELDKI